MLPDSVPIPERPAWEQECLQSLTGSGGVGEATPQEEEPPT